MVSLSGAWESLFWGVFQKSSNPVAILDDQQRVVEVNDSAAELIGTTRLELLGSSLEDHLTAETKAQARRDWQRLLRTGEDVGTRRVLRSDGEEVELDYAGRLVRMNGRSLVLAVVLPIGRVKFFRTGRERSPEELSDREREVVAQIALGRETREIAKELSISPATVRTHVRNAMTKLGVHTRAHLVAVALTDHLLHLPEAGAPTA